MLTRSWRKADHLADRSVWAHQYSAPAAQFAMDDFHCDGRREIRPQSSFIDPTNSSTGHQQVPHYGSPPFKQTTRVFRSGMPYPQVSNTPDFRPPIQRRELFPTQTYHPPIGTGRPFSYCDKFPLKDTVSSTSRELHPSATCSNPFSDSLRPCLKPAQQQEDANSAIDGDLYVPPQRQTSRARPNTRVIARELAQHGVLVRNKSQTRRGSASFRRASHGERQDRWIKPGDNSPPGGISKKRRNSSQRKAAAAARAVVSHSARNEYSRESDKVNQKTPRPSWAQVASGRIKEEPVEDSVTLYDKPLPASVPIKQEKDEDKGPKTWARVAAAAWLENKSKEQKLRDDSFGKPHLNLGNLSLRSKDYSVKVEVKEVLEGDPGEYSRTVQTNQKLLPSKPQQHRRGHLTSNWQLPRTRSWGRCGRVD